MKTNLFPLRLVIFSLFFFFGFNLYSQTESDTLQYYLKTKDGNTFTGKIIEQDSVKVILEAESFGRIQVFRINIRTLEVIEPKRMMQGAYWFDNPQATRYFYSPNGFGLKKGEGYYQNVWVLFNSFAVGVTDNFSLGGGTIPTILFGASALPVWLTPKFSIPTPDEKLNFGVGALTGTVLGAEGSGFGIVYGLTTIGTKDSNISFGLGYGYLGGSWANAPTINFSGMARIGAKGYFITENYFIKSGNQTIVLISLGGRSIINNIGLDYGLFLPLGSDIDIFFAVPWLGLTVPFGGK